MAQEQVFHEIEEFLNEQILEADQMNKIRDNLNYLKYKIDNISFPTIPETVKYVTSPISCFKWATSKPNRPENNGTEIPTGWSKYAPNRSSGQNYDLYMSTNLKQTWVDNGETKVSITSAWSDPVKISGSKGEPGEDGKNTEWIYSYTNSGYSGLYGQTNPGNSPANGLDSNQNLDNWVPNGWYDRALAISINHPDVYASWRDYDSVGKTWNDFNTPILWSHWGEQGLDGDGILYIFKLFNEDLGDNYLDPAFSRKVYNEDTHEWEVNGWSDDPISPTEDMLFCYCSTIKLINGVWGSFCSPKIWTRWQKDGKSVPEYTEEYYAWSSAVSTSTPSEEPLPNTGWEKSINSNNQGYAYLWKKIIRYTLNTSTGEYDETAPQYFRMSGENGTSISIKGTVDYFFKGDSIPSSSYTNNEKAISLTKKVILIYDYGSSVLGGIYDWRDYAPNIDGPSIEISNGNAFTITKGNFGNHLVMWSDEANSWIDLGTFKGESGITYYTHIAWAKDVTFDNNNNVLTCTGFSPIKRNDDDYPWMGILVDTNPGLDSNNWKSYTWTYIKGANGTTPIIYQLNPSLTSINFTRDAMGRYLQDEITVSCGYTRIEGENRTTVSADNVNNQNNNDGIFIYCNYDNEEPEKKSSITVNNDTSYSKVTFILSKNISNPPLAQIDIPILRDGAKGNDGATGRMGYPAGEWKSDFNYTRTNTSTPIVHYTDDDGNDCGYWLLKEDSSIKDIPSENSAKWEKADLFGLVISEMLFTGFAKLGGWVVAGDFFISQYGTLFIKDGTNLTINSVEKATNLINGRVPYAYFDAGDPMSEDLTNENPIKFRPMKVINAVTGEEWMAEGKVHVSSTGDLTIKGSLMFNKIITSPGLGDNYLYSDDGKLKGNILLMHGRSDGFVHTIHFPPPEKFPGASIKIITGTYKNENNNDIWDPININLMIENRNNIIDTDPEYYQSFAVGIPQFFNSLNTVIMGCRATISYKKYSQVELISTKNYFHLSESSDYTWLIVNAV